ncbi:MAG: L,D-transpeptidase family protein [Acidobacteriia bacterium]|nr:L,D-transpeptidase family protein [Terriglobia bacterium]
MKKLTPVLLIALVHAVFLCGIVFGASVEKRADKVLIEKKARKLTLLQGTAVIQTYRIALGSHPIGPKQCQGDQRTPEGHYIIDARKKNSHYHWSLHVSYPNETDRAVARKRRCNPGGDIFIHGLPNGYGWLGKAHTAHDWTLGCVAVTDEEIEEIWRLVPKGTPVEIKP